jgi:hypothetical protein
LSLVFITGFEFGRDAENQVVDFAEGSTAIILVVGIPMLLIGVIIFLVHLAERKQESTETAQDRQ